MINQVNLTDIRSFVLIARLGNFTKAAEVLNVSRSHISRQINNLEKQINVTLLIRTTRTLRLTDIGKQFYEQCEKALQTIDSALLSAVDNIGKMQGKIKVNCVGGYLGEIVIANIVHAFMKKHPNICITLDFNSTRVDLITEKFDIAFRMGSLNDASFIARKLFTLKMGTLASPAYLTKQGRPQHPKELTQHSCLAGSVKKWHFQSRHSHKYVDINIDANLKCKNGRVLVTGALNGNGIIRVPLIYCQHELEAHKLEHVFDEWVVPSVDFSILYHRESYQPKRLKAFIDFVFKNLPH